MKGEVIIELRTRRIYEARREGLLTRLAGERIPIRSAPPVRRLGGRSLPAGAAARGSDYAPTLRIADFEVEPWIWDARGAGSRLARLLEERLAVGQEAADPTGVAPEAAT
ncbi:MAG TPA: hypothetical protein VGK17_15730 [Propionicimonas sp.]